MRNYFRFSNRRLIGIFILLLICTTGIIIWKSLSSSTDRTYAIEGELYLSENQLRRAASPLDGEWHFAWDGLYEPQSFPVVETEMMVLPRAWNGFEYRGEKLPAHGYGTFQLYIETDADSLDFPLALYIPFIHSSYALYLNNDLVAEDGLVAPSSEAHMPSAHTKIVPIKQATDSMQLTLHVANFSYAMGGIWQSPRLGSHTAIRAHYDRQLAFDLFIFGALILMSIYHIALYFLRRKIKSNLYFGLLCFSLAIKNLFTGVAFYYTIWPEATYELGLKIIHISIFSAAALMWLFLRDLFKNEFPLLMSKILVSVSGALILLTLITPSHVYSQLMFPFWILIAVQVVMMLRGVFLSISHDKKGALLILAGIVCFILTVLHDVAIDYRLINGLYLSGAGFFLLIFSQALLLAVKFTDSFRKVENLTEDLTNTNKSYSRFVPKEYLAYLEKESITQVSLGDSSRREMTVFFSDIRSYTSISETMSPSTNFAFINGYMGRVVQHIHANHGIVNQYLGDGILALFTDNPEHAIKAAIAIQKDIAGITDLGGYSLEQPLRNGIGIHSGPLILGMMGTERRMSPGVISDTVNTASRIEGLTKFFGAEIIISDPTLKKIANISEFDIRFLGKVQVKGKHVAHKIYEVLDGLQAKERVLKVSTREDFESGLVCYFNREFEKAMHYFENVLKVNNADLGAKIYRQNSQQYFAEGVTDGWEGALKMELK
jgi:class 3 adenylate cyclase